MASERWLERDGWGDMAEKRWLGEMAVHRWLGRDYWGEMAKESRNVGVKIAKPDPREKPKKPKKPKASPKIEAKPLRKTKKTKKTKDSTEIRWGRCQPWDL